MVIRIGFIGISEEMHAHLQHTASERVPFQTDCNASTDDSEDADHEKHGRDGDACDSLPVRFMQFFS